MPEQLPPDMIPWHHWRDHFAQRGTASLHVMQGSARVCLIDRASATFLMTMKARRSSTNHSGRSDRSV